MQLLFIKDTGNSFLEIARGAYKSTLNCLQDLVEEYKVKLDYINLKLL